MNARTLLLAGSVILQFLLELTLGRVFVAPSIVSLALVYLSLGHDPERVVDGAFWSGLALDLLQHQPPGASSLSLLAGLWAVRLLGRISSGEGGGNLLLTAAAAAIVTDAAFILAASRPFGSGFGPRLLLVLPRAAMTVAFAAALMGLRELAGMLRPGRSRAP